jgi:hypothetical protein
MLSTLSSSTNQTSPIEQVRWYDSEHTIIYAHLKPSFQWHNVFKAHERIRELAQSVAYPVALIADFRDIHSIPPGGFAKSSKQAFANYQALGMRAVVYLINSFNNSIFQNAIAYYGNNAIPYYTVQTLEEAHQILDVQPPH